MKVLRNRKWSDNPERWSLAPCGVHPHQQVGSNPMYSHGAGLPHSTSYRCTLATPNTLKGRSNPEHDLELEEIKPATSNLWKKHQNYRLEMVPVETDFSNIFQRTTHSAPETCNCKQLLPTASWCSHYQPSGQWFQGPPTGLEGKETSQGTKASITSAAHGCDLILNLSWPWSLVLSSPLKNMQVSWDDEIPNIWKEWNNVPNHQADLIGTPTPLIHHHFRPEGSIPHWQTHFNDVHARLTDFGCGLNFQTL